MATPGLPFLFCIYTLCLVIKLSKNFLPELLLLVSFGLCLYQLDLNWFNSHMSRDVLRAQSWNWLGPELGWDYKRLPGPLYYLFLGVLTLTKSLSFILISKLVALYSVIYLLIREVRKIFPATVTGFFLGLFLFMPVFIFSSRNLWNPSLVVLFNCLQFLFILKFIERQEKKYIFLSLVTGFCGLQINFSTLIGFLTFGLTVLLTETPERKLKKLQLAGFGMLLLWLGVWYFADYVPEFKNQLSSFYGLSSFGLNRLFDLGTTLILSLAEIKDYDLFSLYFNSLAELGLVNKGLVSGISEFLFLVYSVLYTVVIAAVVREYFRHRRTLDLFLIVYNVLFLLSILIFKNKENIPYRYGLAIYPVQFFLLSYGLYLIWNKKKIFKVFQLLAVGTAVFYIYFNAKMFEAQSLLGRAHHTNYDNLELTVRNKEYLYGFLQKNVQLEGDPFNYLHGRTANKFRLKEMNWEQTIPYYSLYFLTTGQKFNFNEEQKNTVNGDNWLVQLKNLHELKEDPTGALRITELSSEVFPKNLQLTYYDAARKLLKTDEWKNTSLILPSAFVPELSSVHFIRLKFQLDTSTHKYINLLLDDNESYNFAYRNNYELRDFTADAKTLQPLKVYDGYFLVQNQYIFEPPKNNKGNIEIEVALINKFRNYSRIDIFTTDYIMPQEELFPKLMEK